MSASAEAATFEFALPSLGADMDAGKVIEWCVEIGDTVSRGDILAVVQTEKSDIDVEIWHGGVVEEFLVELGEEIEVGTPIARLSGSGGEVTPPAPREDLSVPEPERPGADSGAYPSPVEPAASSEGIAQTTAASPPPKGDLHASPYARRLAHERGLDLGSLQGTGPGGAIVAADVMGAVVPPPSDKPPPPKRAPTPSGTSSMRQIIAERMSKANREIPHYHLSLDVDLTDVLRDLATFNESRPISKRVLPAAIYIHAVAGALTKHPELNGFWVDDAFQPGEAINIAMAISLRRGGLVAPHVERADELTLPETMQRLQELVSAARTGNLKARWMSGSTITITNLGDQGADLVHGVISPPQVALVGVGQPRQRAWVVNGAVEPRTIATLTLAADHRATDGLVGSRFLNAIVQRLARLPEEP